MADQLQLRGGTTAQTNVFTGAQREVTVNTDLNTLVVHDNLTPGGFPLATQAQVSNGTFYFNDNTGGGSAANAYILAAKANTNRPTQYLDGIQLGFVTTNANLAGPSTANFTGLGVKSIKYPGGIDPAAGEIFGRVYMIYDQANDWLELQRKALGPPPQIRNIGASVSGNALIATMNPAVIDFRAPTLSNGTPNTRTITSALSITAPSGATLGTVSGTLSRIVILALDNAGVVSLGLVNQNSTLNLDETTLINATAIGAGSTSVNTVYATTNMSGVPFRVIGYIESTQPTAGVWTSGPSQVQGQGGQTILGVARFAGSAAQNSTSGTSIQFTGIPSWAKKININFAQVSTSGTSPIIVQLGVPSAETSGYVGAGSRLAGGSLASSVFGTGFGLAIAAAADNYSGSMTLNQLTANTWTANGAFASPGGTNFMFLTAGAKTLASTLSSVIITTVGGIDTFDLGVINVSWEG